LLIISSFHTISYKQKWSIGNIDPVPEPEVWESPAIKMPMSKGGKESENWPWKQSISPKTLTLCVTISAPMSVDFVSPYTLMRVATWPILKGRSIRLTWRGEWPGRPGMRL
jgi:hypothetical protein